MKLNKSEHAFHQLDDPAICNLDTEINTFEQSKLVYLCVCFDSLELSLLHCCFDCVVP